VLRPAGGGPASPEEPSLTPDRIQLSNLSATLNAAIGDSATHLKKLSTLAAATLSGTYHVDSGVVSDSIIRQSLQLGL
jgi:hypothetical protein